MKLLTLFDRQRLFFLKNNEAFDLVLTIVVSVCFFLRFLGVFCSRSYQNGPKMLSWTTTFDAQNGQKIWSFLTWNYTIYRFFRKNLEMVQKYKNRLQYPLCGPGTVQRRDGPAPSWNQPQTPDRVLSKEILKCLVSDMMPWNSWILLHTLFDKALNLTYSLIRSSPIILHALLLR